MEYFSHSREQKGIGHHISHLELLFQMELEAEMKKTRHGGGSLELGDSQQSIVWQSEILSSRLWGLEGEVSALLYSHLSAAQSAYEKYYT